MFYSTRHSKRMSYRPVNYKTAVNVVKQDGGTRLKQDFTAIQVHDPYTENLPNTPPLPPHNSASPGSGRMMYSQPRDQSPFFITSPGPDPETHAKIDGLAARQVNIARSEHYSFFYASFSNSTFSCNFTILGKY